MKFNIRFDFTSDFVCSKFSFQKGYYCFVEVEHDYFLFNCFWCACFFEQNSLFKCSFDIWVHGSSEITSECKMWYKLYSFKSSYFDTFIDIFGREWTKICFKIFHCEYTKGNSRQYPISKAGKIFCCLVYPFTFWDFLIFIVILSFNVDTEVWKGQAKDLEK